VGSRRPAGAPRHRPATSPTTPPSSARRPRRGAACAGLDILVNNAGVIEPISDIAASDPAAWARNISVNLVGAYNAVRAVLPGMLAGGAGGTIVNVSSGAAFRPLEGWSAYCSGKAGLAMLTRAVALETAGRGVRVFGFAPAPSTPACRRRSAPPA
jgi:NAD(P)-dependent dehydrogenase (short-subunit alcohol dehydrogenase family)